MARQTKLESDFKAELQDELKRMFPGCFMLKNDEQILTGVPDMLLLWEDKWAMLEVKRSIFATFRPLQEHYLNLFDRMSFAAMICPENKEEVLDELQRSFGTGRNSRRSIR